MLGELASRVLNNAAICGPLNSATHIGTVGEPGEGAYVRIWLKIEGARIVDATYLTHGCPSCAAAAGVTVTLARGRTLEQAGLIEPHDIDLVLGGLPEGKGHFADMAAQSLRRAMVSPIEGEKETV